MKIAVIGGGVSGFALAKFAAALGNDVMISDAKKLPEGVYDSLGKLGISYETGHNMAYRADMILLSSGIPPLAPVVLNAQSSGIPVTGELEFVLPHLKGRIAGVTGTNGKSTVTALIGHLLGGFSDKTAVGGNLGKAMADFAYDSYDYIVLELSSAQLHYLKQRRNADFRAAVITNLEPDHIDWHGSYEKYIEAKSRVISLIADDGGIFMRSEDIRKINNLPLDKVTALSWETDGRGAASGIYMKKDRAVLTEGGLETELFKYADFPLIGRHNCENAAFAMAAVMKAAAQNFVRYAAVEKLSSYKGLPHRCEFIAERNGVKYINDSKATNVGAVVAALNSIDGEKIIILGGRGKGEDYAPLSKSVKARAKHAIVLGSEKVKIINSLAENGMMNVTAVDTIPEAVAEAKRIAVSGDIVLLSPACTSWDQYKSFEERGENFRSSVINGEP